MDIYFTCVNVRSTSPAIVFFLIGEVYCLSHLTQSIPALRGTTKALKCKRSAREINRGERPKVEYVSMTDSRTIRVSAHDFTGRGNRAGIAANCAGRIEAREYAFRGPYKTVGNAESAGEAAGRVGTDKS